MTRIATTAAAALAGAAAAVALTHGGDAGAAGPATPQVLHVGDRVTVDGEPLGCRVARRGGHAVVDCRRGGDLAGTYGTMISARRAEVVRYRSNTVAKVVFTASHGGGARRCGD
jgi:hypothetical protein